ITLRDRHAYSACFQIAQEGLDRFQTGDGESERVAAASLWRRKHDALTPLGQITQEMDALVTALELIGEAEGEEARFSRASARLRMGRALAQAGDVRQALIQLEAALADFEEGNHPKDRAVTLGDV